MKTTPDFDNESNPKLFLFCGPSGKFSPYGLFPTVIGPTASDLSLLKETLETQNINFQNLRITVCFSHGFVDI